MVGNAIVLPYKNKGLIGQICENRQAIFDYSGILYNNYIVF
jgi:hypothetical protein